LRGLTHILSRTAARQYLTPFVARVEMLAIFAFHGMGMACCTKDDILLTADGGLQGITVGIYGFFQ